MKRLTGVVFVLVAACVANAEVQVVNGKKYECRDGLCYLVEDDVTTNFADKGIASSESGESGEKVRVTQGYLTTHEFVSFLRGGSAGDVTEGWAEAPILMVLWIVLLGGFLMNLTPCVLPMVPINLMIIGRSAKRGLAYGLGIALAYGLLGVAAAVGGLAFGDIQGSPWFNAAVAVVFVGLALAMFEVWLLDLSGFRRFGRSAPRGEDAAGTVGGIAGTVGGIAGTVFAFGMGALSAVLAGACVAPVLIAVLVFTADLVARGKMLALGMPFVMGLGMALPWPFAGAGMKVLPKPGAWMKWVNRVFGVVVLGFAARYGWLAWRGFSSQASSSGLSSSSSLSGSSSLSSPSCSARTMSATPATLNSQLSTLKSESARPILVDCWATWCKNCAAMERVMEKPEVREALKPFKVIKLQAEDIGELRKLKGFESIRGLPAFVIFE